MNRYLITICALAITVSCSKDEFEMKTPPPTGTWLNEDDFARYQAAQADTASPSAPAAAKVDPEACPAKEDRPASAFLKIGEDGKIESCDLEKPDECSSLNANINMKTGYTAFRTATGETCDFVARTEDAEVLNVLIQCGNDKITERMVRVDEAGLKRYHAALSACAK